MHTESGDPTKAVELMTQAIEAKPLEYSYHVNLGNVLLAQDALLRPYIVTGKYLK